MPSAVVHAHAGDNVVGFRVIDFGEGDTARGDFGGYLPSVIRPNWKWQTGYFAPNGMAVTDVCLPVPKDVETPN